MRELNQIGVHMPIEMMEPVCEAFPEIEIVALPTEGALPATAKPDALLTLPWGTPNVADVISRGVRWVHAYGTGVDGFPFEYLQGATLTCSRGASAHAISEWVLAVLLAAVKELPQRWLDSPPERWSLANLGTLEGRTLALVGFGGIAQAVAKRALPFGMRVRALRRTGAPSPIRGVEVATTLEALLADADHVVVAAPETPATRHMMNDAAFEALKPGAHLVNIARGGLVDQDALRRALDRGRVGLATLDCVEPEPLPEGHWLYSHPNVRLSAHVSWSSPFAHASLLDRFLENIGRYLRGDELAYQVDPVERY